jgi:hypothetical protein
MTEVVEHGGVRDANHAVERSVVDSARGGWIVALTELAARAVELGYVRDQRIRNEVTRALNKTVASNRERHVEAMPL